MEACPPPLASSLRSAPSRSCPRRCSAASRAWSTRSSRMTGFDPLRAVEGEVLLAPGARGDGLEQEELVIAGVEAVDHAPHEPALAALEDRQPLGPVVPLAVRELVDLVAGLAAEELGQVGGVGRDAMDRQRGRVAAPAMRAVLAREADREARRIDAGLRGEADEAAEALFAGAGRDDEHRVLEVHDDHVEGPAQVHGCDLPQTG